MDVNKKKIIKELSRKYNIPEKVIREMCDSPFVFMKQMLINKEKKVLHLKNFMKVMPREFFLAQKDEDNTGCSSRDASEEQKNEGSNC